MGKAGKKKGHNQSKQEKRGVSVQTAATAASLFFIFLGKLTFCASSFFTANSLVLLPSSAAAAAAVAPLPLPTPAKNFSTQPSQRPPVSFFFFSS